WSGSLACAGFAASGLADAVLVATVGLTGSGAASEGVGTLACASDVDVAAE
ncbi:hypothetical protein Pgy4_38156, partial [Pseudomonas savastanoi pv. glycinea str. race 4]